jgi:hypothetical protein
MLPMKFSFSSRKSKILIKISPFFLAAHCSQNKGQSEPVLTEYVTAMLGKHDMNDFIEDGAKNYSVREIVLHPEWQWDQNVNSSYHADIAIAVLKETVEFTSNIKPVCLPQQSSAEVVGEEHNSRLGTIKLRRTSCNDTKRTGSSDY